MPIKKMLINIPSDLNKKLDYRLIAIRDNGVKITKVQLVLDLVKSGLLKKIEKS